MGGGLLKCSKKGSFSTLAVGGFSAYKLSSPLTGAVVDSGGRAISPVSIGSGIRLLVEPSTGQVVKLLSSSLGMGGRGIRVVVVVETDGISSEVL